jgi:hypothetical protein
MARCNYEGNKYLIRKLESSGFLGSNFSIFSLQISTYSLTNETNL